MLSLLDLFFPKICVGCSREGDWLCESCYLSIQSGLSSRNVLLSAADTIAELGSLAGLLWVGPFGPGPLREAIHHLKYNGIRELAQPLGQLLDSQIKNLEKEFFLEPILLIPIPLHRQRSIERGFNQAELIARATGRVCHSQLLRRSLHRPAQAGLNREQRRTNLKNAFSVNPAREKELTGRTIILVDDVTTTGSTLQEAAQVLLKVGARGVWGAVLARD